MTVYESNEGFVRSNREGAFKIWRDLGRSFSWTFIFGVQQNGALGH